MLFFTRVLHVEGKGYLHFTFHCIISPHKKRYHAVVLTTSPQCFHFNLEERNDQWRIMEAPRPPEWILQLEDKLAQTILLHQLPSVTSYPVPDLRLPVGFQLSQQWKFTKRAG